MKGWIAVDLDGTLAHEDGWKGEDHIGAPIPAMVAFVKALISAGEDVRIFTARVGMWPEGSDDHERNRRIVQAWCFEHLGQALEVTAIKDMGMHALYDDRAIQVETNTGRIL